MTAQLDRRWLMASLVFLATVVNYLDRQTLSVVAPVLREEFAMTNAGYSRVISAFMLAYTIMNGFSGVLVDRIGTRRGYALCMAWWSGATVLHAWVKGPWSLALCRLLLGMGEAGNWPAGVRVFAEWFPPKERALASGFFNSGATVGAIAAPPLVVWILLAYGWRAAFAAVGSLGFFWLICWWILYHPPAGSAVTSPVAAGPEALRVPHLLKSRFLWSFTVSKVFIDPVWYFYIFWFPEYLRHGRGFDMASIGRYAWIPFLMAGLGNFGGGWLSIAFSRLGMPPMKARKSAVLLAAAIMMAAIPAVLTSTTALSIALIGLAMAGYTAATANMLALPADLFPHHSVGSVYGLASMGSGFGGMVFALLTGWTIDRLSYTAAFIGFGLLPLTGAFVLWRFTRDRPAVRTLRSLPLPDTSHSGDNRTGTTVL